jgi:hypothetical protein
MYISFFLQTVQLKHPALQRLWMQCLSLIFITLTACVSTPSADLERWLPEGYYKFDCPIIYEKGMVQLRHDRNTVRVELLEKFDGAFSFSVRPNQDVSIIRADMGLPGLNRSFRGDGRLLKPGHAEGRAVTWLKTGGPISRNHREGPWTLRPATREEITAFTQQQKALEERKNRARKAGLDI